MTRINKMVCHGFKSFAKHTELVFGGDFNAVLGPNGSGKCLVGSSLVHLADGSLVQIKDLFEKAAKKNLGQELDDGIMISGDGTNIQCLDLKTLKVVKKPVQAFIKRTSPDDLMRIETRSGKRIVSTKYHPLFILKNGEVKSARADELKQGTKIAIPRQSHVNIESKYFYELIDLIKKEDGLYVPWKEEYALLLRKLKKDKLWKSLAKEISIPLNTIKGILDRQSVNFAYLVRIMRYRGYSNRKIIDAITHIKSKNSNKYFKIPWENSKRFSRFLGYLLAEGRLPILSNQIWFTNGTEELVEDYKELIESLFGLKASVNEYKPNCWDVIAYSASIRKILTKFGMPIGGTGDKEITNLFLAHSTNEECSSLLNGLFCGDGYVSKSTIEIVTKSKKLALGIETLLLRLGILFNTQFVVKMATGSGYSGIYKSIVVSDGANISRFKENVDLVHDMKRERINNLVKRKPNPNLDLVEVNSLVKQVAKSLKVNIKKSKKSFPRIDAYVYNQCSHSRIGLQQLVTELFLPKQIRTQELKKLMLLSNSDIYWDEITDVKEVRSKEKWVYDLCVEDHHNFIANNMFVHNSNILDALCFVLGKSSSKSLRAERAANLIYNGGKLKNPSSKGEVSIFFDNKNRKFPVQDDEIKISRIVKQNGQSKYQINDKTVTRQQILELLSSAKIDPDGYNIILQGDIVNFVNMPPSQRRELIDEISGISVYEERKHKADLEIGKVETKLKEAEIILTERGMYLKELKSERNQALKFKDAQDKIKENKASYLKIQINKKEKLKEALQKRIDEHKGKFEKINDKVKKIREENQQKKQEIEDITHEVEEKGEKDQMGINKDIENLKVGLARKTTKIDSLKNEVTKIKKRKEELRNDSGDVEKRISELKQTVEDLKNSRNEIGNEKAEIEKKIEGFKKKHKLDATSSIEMDVEKIDNNIEEKQKGINELREKQQAMLREKDRIEFQINSADEKIDKVKEIESEHKIQIQELKEKREELKKMTHELNSLLNDDANLAVGIAEVRKRLMASEQELARLNTRKLHIKEKVARKIAVKKVLEQRKKIRGIYGTIADLGKVDSKYSIALEVAAGPRLNSIVVEDDKVAANMIKYLKQNKLGIATFLPLNKIKSKPAFSSIKELSSKKGVHGNALDLVDFDEKFEKVFSYVFQNTLVVQSIETARSIGVGKARMVTLDGDITELSGAMRGGFRKIKEGYGFEEKDLTKEMGRFEESVKKDRKEIDSLEKQRVKNEEILVKTREEKAHLEGDIIKTEKSLHLDDSDLEISKSKKEELKELLKGTDRSLEKMKTEIVEINRIISDLKASKQELRTKINQLRNPRLLAELNTFEQKRTDFNEELINLNNEVKNYENEVKNILIPEKEKIVEILKQHGAEEKEFSELISLMMKEVKEENKNLGHKEEEAAKFFARFKQLFQKRTKINEEISKNEVEVNKRLDDSREVELKINTISLDQARVSAELAGLNQEFEQYRDVKLNLNKTEEEYKKDVAKFERILGMMGSINMKALEIYETVEKEFNKLLEKKKTLEGEKLDIIKLMDEIADKKKDLFMNSFNEVNKHFQDIFSQLTTKGEATMELENPENPFEAGLNIKVRLSANKYMDIKSLSGGEKTLTALAFIFAIQENDPASFYVLDEVDAALDKRNSEKLAKLLRKYSEKAQYILISHNDGIISEADSLFGVSMNEHGMSNVVSLRV